MGEEEKLLLIKPAECALGLTDPDDFIFQKNNVWAVVSN